MAELMSLALEAIEVPERLRSVSADHAGMLAADIKLRGLLQPVVVRGPLPEKSGSRGRWVLLAGAHRLAAARLLGWAEIPAVKAQGEADDDGDRLVEISENLFRNDLSALERAWYIVQFRQGWERVHGRQRRGGDRRSAAFRAAVGSKSQDETLKLGEEDFLDRAGLSGFSEHIAERIGLSRAAILRAQSIILGLDPELRVRLMGTAVADNQALLIRISRLFRDEQRKAVAAIDAGTPAEEAVAALFPLPEVDEHKPYERTVKAWGRLTLRQRRSWVREHRDELARLLAEVDGDA